MQMTQLGNTGGARNKEASPRYKSVALATGFSFVLLLIYFIFFAIT
jgi:hypothetical protein